MTGLRGPVRGADVTRGLSSAKVFPMRLMSTRGSGDCDARLSNLLKMIRQNRKGRDLTTAAKVFSIDWI